MDEVQVAVRNSELGELMGELSKEAIKRTEEFFSFRCPLDCDYAIGQSWKETH